MVENNRNKRLESFKFLHDSLKLNNKKFICLYFNKIESLSVKCFIDGDSLYLYLNNEVNNLIERVNYSKVYKNLSEEQKDTFVAIYNEVKDGIETKSKISLSKVTRGILGPILNPNRSTINYNVYIELYIKKEDILDLNETHKFLFEDSGKFIKLQDYIDLVHSHIYESRIVIEENKYSSQTNDLSRDFKNYSAKEMVSHIYNYIDSRGFIFDIEDIANLYLSMKTKPFVLMAGISGTGKSKLVKLFANAIGATAENGRYRLISVKPDWNDGSDLFGYIDINGDYIPGVLTEIIYDANKEENLDKPYIVCLDEMNLARVEYYLSDYLSVIETREKTLSGIKTNKVFPKEYFKKDNKYKDIYFSDNIIILGTVNMDDTTFPFSEKVLDRANTIEFSKVKLDLLDFPDKEVDSKLVSNKNFKSKYLTIKDALIDNRDFVEKVNREIIDIHNILKIYNKHFGYRVRDEIVFYMLENHNNKLLAYDQAFDYQLHQKVLPRISGSDYEVKEMLLKLFNHINQTNQLVDTYGYLDNVKLDNSKYKKTSEKIIQMLRGYENGYVSFW